MNGSKPYGPPAVSRLPGKCQRGSHSERHVPPHPNPLPRGEGESSFQHTRRGVCPTNLPNIRI